MNDKLVKYKYTDRYPKPNSLSMWETSLPEGHRMIVRVRRNMLSSGPNNIHYQPRCSCRQWKYETWVRQVRLCQGIFMREHITTLNRQGRFQNV